MAELAEEGDLAEGGGGDSFVLDLETDALEGDDLVGGLVPGLVDDAIGSLSEVGLAGLLNLLVSVGQ